RVSLGQVALVPADVARGDLVLGVDLEEARAAVGGAIEAARRCDAPAEAAHGGRAEAEVGGGCSCEHDSMVPSWPARTSQSAAPAGCLVHSTIRDGDRSGDGFVG